MALMCEKGHQSANYGGHCANKIIEGTCLVFTPIDTMHCFYSTSSSF